MRVDNPGTCLALSGGGLRAGTIALGVLQELHLADYLRNVDIVASVSGGGYPVYGLLMRMERDGQALSELLRPNSEYLENVRTTPFLDYSDLGTKTVVTGVAALPNLVFKPLSGISEVGLGNTASVLYAKNIHDTFYRRTWGNITSFFLRDVSPARLARQGFPYPIFVAAVSTGQTPPLADHHYDVRDLFEQSPNWVGSESAGYFAPAPALLHIWQAMIASAAAIDSPRTSNGVYVSGQQQKPKPRLRDAHKQAGASQKDVQGMPNMLKALTIGAVQPVRLHGTPMFLSDGGFIENLAVMPLLRRGCKTIVSVDASSDPDFDLVSLDMLRGYIEHMGGSIELPPELPKKAVPDRGWHTHNRPYKIKVNLFDRVTTVHLLKLSLDTDQLAKYPKAVQNYAMENWSPRERKSESCLQNYPQTVFPNVPTCGPLDGGLLGRFLTEACSFTFEETFRLCYEQNEADAYIELGRFMACGYLNSVGRACVVTSHSE